MVLHNCSDTAFVHAAAGKCPQKQQRQGHEPVGSQGLPPRWTRQT